MYIILEGWKMPNIFVLLQDYIEYFPLVALVGLILAGFNLPISEDLIIITGALLSHEDETLLIYILGAIYIGAIASDFFVYWVGRMARKGASITKFFTKVVPEKALTKMHNNLDKYGIFTFIIGRFIPFGIRNTLFFTSGFFNLRLRIFAFYDVIAAMISINTLFFVVYYFGEAAKRPFKIAGIILFTALVCGIISLIIRLIVLWRRRIALKKENRENPPQTDANPLP
jgi:membrane protein DedA with SNARE-associated domain